MRESENADRAGPKIDCNRLRSGSGAGSGSGGGSNVASGSVSSSRADAWASAFYSFWEGFPVKGKNLHRALIWLSYYTQVLLRRMEAQHGLDIEFCISGGRLYLLQARPITTPEESEEVLTSANHKEILPPQPSPLMTAIISKAGYRLFDYYRELDPTLPRRAFIREAAGMPWINLSALLDVMVHWGLPTQLACRSVGAEDFYQVGLRPYRIIVKIPVFFKVFQQQMNASRRVEKWLENINVKNTVFENVRNGAIAHRVKELTLEDVSITSKRRPIALDDVFEATIKNVNLSGQHPPLFVGGSESGAITVEGLNPDHVECGKNVPHRAVAVGGVKRP